VEATPVLPRLAYLTLCRSIQLLALLARGDAAKDLEIIVLRHQLAVLRRQTHRPKLQPADRALRWHRRLVAGAWTYPHRGRGRPPLDEDVHATGITTLAEARLGRVHRHDLLGGLLHEYRRAA
jgi:hypothetical protein